MATDTPLSSRNLVIYEVFVRNHGLNGTFADVEADLERIRGMGVDILWLMPIHPIGKIERKGSLGSPYSIVDYRAVNPEYGSKQDFQHLIEKAHAMGLKVMIDVVYNHTAHDSVLVSQHPDWFHQDAQGKPVTTVPEWSDVIDLKFPNPDLEAYLIETLQQWVRFGVDGFRCDVASLLPETFWVQARAAVAQVKPGVLWLAESVHASFVADRRAQGLRAISDSQVYSGFDLTYAYDIWPVFRKAVTGQLHFGRYLEMLLLQDCIYPANYNKMRYTENHDNTRIMGLAASPDQAMAWTAFEAFNKGTFLVYAGQEAGASHTPSLFDVDKVDWQDYRLQTFITSLCRLKKDPALTSGQFVLLENRDFIQAAWQDDTGGLLGIFNVQKLEQKASVPLPDGTYQDALHDQQVVVAHGQIDPPRTAVLLRYTGRPAFQQFHSDLF